MTKRRVKQGSAQPVVLYDPAQEKFLEGSAIPATLFDADGNLVSVGVGGNNGEFQYNNDGAFGGATDIVFEDTALQLNNDATVWVDFNFGGASLRAPASAPDFISLDSGNVQVRAFDGNATIEQLFGQVEMDHMWKEGSIVYPHIHWMPVNANTGNVKWQLEYNICSNATTPDGETLISVVAAAPEVAWEVNFVELPSIDMSGFGIGTQFAFRLFRDPTDGDDTYGSDAAILTFGLHVEVNTMGSRQKGTK